MSRDDDRLVCLCFHVSYRKVVNWVRVERPKKAAQLSECFGAGTGCGWCRDYLRRIFEASQTGEDPGLPGESEYQAGRQIHIQEGRGKPPENR